MPSTEAQARITINKMMENAGWRFVPDAQGRRENIICEHRVSGKKFAPDYKFGNDFEHAQDGFIDYLLLNSDQRPVALVEAKRESEQARKYAEKIGVEHIFLSNGLAHYYWNLRQGNPVKLSRFLPLEQLGKATEWCPDSKRLAAMTVDENYIAVSQDAAWLSYSPAERKVMMTNKKIRLLRDYQINAIHALQQAATRGSDRFSFEMATGTGKTLLAAAIAKLYIRTDNATRILFLVDRLELENQAWKNFNAYLANDGINTVIYKQKRGDWTQAQVVVTTIQSFATKNRFLHEFAPTDFQLIISDEAHRTISSNNRAIFEYFIGAKLGLTATPKDYLKGAGKKMEEDDPREFEQRLLLDTYSIFGCPDGTPTFRFSLLEAVQHQPPYLVNPTTFDTRTDITTQMLSDEGYRVTVPANEDGQEHEFVFGKKDYERKFFSDETNMSFVRCFFDNAKCDPITGESGKTIMFAASRKHATKLVTLLNEEATRRWPREYGAGSTFAVQVTSDIPGAQQITIDFANNNLNGKSKWRANKIRDYDTSRTRVCVTVGMMTTGYDCGDVLNIALARPIFSPTDFIQIKGRGTRLYAFKHDAGNGRIERKKNGFALFDFFANCEYFEKDFNYDQQLSLPKNSFKEGADSNAKGSIGMRIDREMYRERFAHQAQEAESVDSTLREALEAEDWPTTEERIRQLLFNKPEDFWNLQKLREIYKTTDRLPTLREILAKIFGFIAEIPDRNQLANEEFEKFEFAMERKINPTHIGALRTVFEACVLNTEKQRLIKEGRFAEIVSEDHNLHISLECLEQSERKAIIEYIQYHIPHSAG